MAEKVPQFRKQRWYPQPHNIQGSMAFECDDATLDSTIVPIAFYDEGLGAPSAIETNPTNAAFAVVADQPNCMVGSNINIITADFRFSLTSKALDDNLAGIRVGTMPIFMAFIDDYTAIDELSSTEVQDVLNMQTESTDRQGGPLYVVAKDMAIKAAGQNILGANVPFLDTTQAIESTAFSIGTFYDALQFMTIAPKLKKVQGGLRWDILDANRPNMIKNIFVRPKVKAMNPFTYFGLLVVVPIQGDTRQIGVITRDYTAATQYVDCDWNITYNEWNPEFNMSMV